MKLATLRDGSRDGQLAVVSRDLSLAHFATGIATTLGRLLDDWNFLSPQLEDLAATLDGGKARHAFPFDPARCAPPLPRPVAWWHADAAGSLAPRPGPAMPPPMAGHLPAAPALAAITGDIDADADPAAAAEGLRLLLLAAAPPCAADGLAPGGWFGPVAVTPDELGPAWHAGRVAGRLSLERPDGTGGLVDAAAVDWPRLLARAARGRGLAAGSLVVAGLAGPDEAADGAGRAAGRRRSAAWRVGFTTPSGEAPLGRIEARIEVGIEPAAEDEDAPGPGTAPEAPGAAQPPAADAAPADGA